jgi:predicted TIM-barrel fold metal-dependent hydrolase
MVTQILSADSHVLEPPDLWTTRMEKQFRDKAPHVEKNFDGREGDFFVCPPLRPFNPFTLGCAGVPPEEQAAKAALGYAACRPGSWDPVERLKDMDADSLGAEVFYCGYGMSMFSHPDEGFQRDAHRSYNDWAAEYASYAPKRLFPIANISMTDVEEDLKELHRVAKMGFRGIFISNDPLPERRYDNEMWEPFWSAVEEYDLPVNIHILTVQRGSQVSATNPLVDGVLLPVPAFRTIAEMIVGGVFDRHPNLKIVSVENDIGWIPNYLKRFDWYSYRFAPRYPQMKMGGGEYWRQHVYATFQDDIPGIRCRDLIGVDRLMWGSDYPHFDSTFPDSVGAIERNFEGVPDDERELILSGNMLRLYNLEGVIEPAPAAVS